MSACMRVGVSTNNVCACVRVSEAVALEEVRELALVLVSGAGGWKTYRPFAVGRRILAGTALGACARVGLYACVRV
jgi:hypothetical protein